MVESKALKRLGIVRKKRTFVGVVLSFVRSVFVLGLVGACVWGGIQFFRHRSATNPVSSDNSAVGAIEGKCDGRDMHICEHLKTEQVEQIDIQTKSVGGRVEATARQYWFRLSVDERWYLESFVPRVKRYLSEIAPRAETEDVVLDTKSLSYANDGADRLHKLRYGTLQPGDCYAWIGAGNRNDIRNRRARISHEKVPVLLIDQVLKNGAVTQATCYLLDRAEFEKLEHWIAREILRERVDIALTITSDGMELASETWSTHGVRPLGWVRWSGMRCYAMTPWIEATRGERYCFLGCQCRNPDGLPSSVSVQWSL